MRKSGSENLETNHLDWLNKPAQDTISIADLDPAIAQAPKVAKSLLRLTGWFDLRT